MENIIDIFESRFYFLNTDDILRLNAVANQGEINNVVTGLEEKFYCLQVIEDTEKLEYQLIFGSNTNELNGLLLKLDTSLKERDELTFLFAKHIIHEHIELNVIDVFNTFQRKVRTMYEKYDFMTFNPLTFKDILDPNPLMIAKGKKGIIGVLEIDKKVFYKDFFKGIGVKELVNGQEYVYLMYNSRNDLIKIGQSKNPKYREKTLQAEEPEIEILCLYKAPKSIEKELHNNYKSKRQRGEWFSLTFKDLENIKIQMKEYN